MMGPERLSEIRAKVRKAFNGTDAELLAWFNLQLEDGCKSRSRIRSRWTPFGCFETLF